MKKWKGIGVFIEQDEGKILDISWELLNKARELADKSKEKVYAFLLTADASPAKDVIAHGADVCVVAEHKLLDNYRWETYSKILSEIIDKYRPSSLIFGATPNGRDLAGRLAVRLKTGLTADVIDLDMEGDLLVGSVPGFGGSIVAIIKCEHARPQMATVRPGVFTAGTPNKKRKGKTEEFKVSLSNKDISTQILEKIKVDAEDISKAEKLVAVGRGGSSKLEEIKKMAELLGAAVGVTRPLCDAGMMPRNYQVGSTGVIVRPKYSLVIGASGAMHFTSGIKDSDMVIAINTDEEAPIFEHADYQVVGDAEKIIPLVLKKLEHKLLQEVKK